MQTDQPLHRAQQAASEQGRTVGAGKCQRSFGFRQAASCDDQTVHSCGSGGAAAEVAESDVPPCKRAGSLSCMHPGGSAAAVRLACIKRALQHCLKVGAVVLLVIVPPLEHRVQQIGADICRPGSKNRRARRECVGGGYQ